MANRKNENKQIIAALQKKLGYPTISSLESLNGEAPNSCTILDTNTSLVWKIARNRPHINPRLELEVLETLPSSTPNIAKHLDYGELTVNRQTYFYLVFPYVDGTSLRSEIIERKKHNKTFSTEEIINVGNRISEAIFALNEAGIVHQDIKPDNIIFGSNGSVVLIDLGIALFIQDSPKQLKKLEGPYAYMSPEKLSVIGNGEFRRWSKLNFTSDLFSLGLILLEMATLRRVNGDLEPDLANLYKIGQVVPGLGIGDKLSDYVSAFLHQSQYDRQISVIEVTGNKDVKNQKSEAKPKLWLHSSSKSMSIVGSFIENHQFKSDFGLIYKAAQARSENNIKDIASRGQVSLDKGGSFLLDPCTYLQVLDKKHHRGTRYFSYAGIVSPEQLVNPPKFVQGYAENYVKEVLESQKEMGVSSVISPYLYIETVDDFSAEANFILWRETNKYLGSDSENCYFALLVSERLVLSRKELMELALMISNHRFAKKIYLRLESKRESSQPMWDREYMENLRDFLAFVSQASNILLASSGIEGLGYMCFGLTEVGTNPLFSQRKFSFGDKSSTRGGGTEPIPRYFARPLLNEVLVPQEVDTPMSANPTIKPIFDCSCGFCPNRDREPRLKHYLVNYDEMFSIISKSKDLKIFDDWIETAIDNYELLEDGGLQFSPSTNGNFLSVWRQVFTQ